MSTVQNDRHYCKLLTSVFQHSCIWYTRTVRILIQVKYYHNWGSAASSHKVRPLGLPTLLSFTIHADCLFKKVSKSLSYWWVALQIFFLFFFFFQESVASLLVEIMSVKIQFFWDLVQCHCTCRSFILKMIKSFETSRTTYPTTQCHIP